jgi:Sec-independent protein translocase protein TatA
MNLGGSEFLVIAVFALLLFGPSLLAFWFGYVLGQRKSGETAETMTTAVAPVEEAAGGSTSAGDEADVTEGDHD